MPVYQGRRSARRRRGTATTEFAVCLPILVTLVLGTVETCSMIFLQQSLTAAAYEGARRSAKVGTTLAAEEGCQEVLAARNLVEVQVTVDPPNPESMQRGAYVTVSASAPCGVNGILPARFYAGRRLSASCTMMRE